MNEFDNFCNEYSDMISDKKEAFCEYIGTTNIENAESHGYIVAYRYFYDMWMQFSLKIILDEIGDMVNEAVAS